MEALKTLCAGLALSIACVGQSDTDRPASTITSIDEMSGVDNNSPKMLAAGDVYTIDEDVCTIVDNCQEFGCAEDPQSRRAVIKVATVSCGGPDGLRCKQCNLGGADDCCAGAAICMVCKAFVCMDEGKSLSCCLD